MFIVFIKLVDYEISQQRIPELNKYHLVYILSMYLTTNAQHYNVPYRIQLVKNKVEKRIVQHLNTNWTVADGSSSMYSYSNIKWYNAH